MKVFHESLLKGFKIDSLGINVKFPKIALYRSSLGSSWCSSRSVSSGARSQRSATPSPSVPRPRQPPPTQGIPPPPPALSSGMLLRESQSPYDELQYDYEL